MEIISFDSINKNASNELEHYFNCNKHIEYQFECTPYYHYKNISGGRKFHLLIAVENNNLIGTALLMKDSHLPYISYVFVFPQHRNKGVCKALVQQIPLYHKEYVTSNYTEEGYKYLRPQLQRMGIHDGEKYYASPVKITNLYKKDKQFIIEYERDEKYYIKNITEQLHELYESDAYNSLVLIKGEYHFEIYIASEKLHYIPAIYFLYRNREKLIDYSLEYEKECLSL